MNSAIEFIAGQLYTNEEIYQHLAVGNSGGIRVSLNADKTPRRIVLLTQSHTRQSSSENPYSDRLEGDVLVYTAAGKAGDQALTGANKRITEQSIFGFPIYCFCRLTSRRESRGNPRQWQFIGLIRYLRYFPSKQIDANGNVRSVWQFDLRVHAIPLPVSMANETSVCQSILQDSLDIEEQQIDLPDSNAIDPTDVERERSRLLKLHPQDFELTVRNVIAASGFRDVCVTKYSSDGGIDVTAIAGLGMWPLGDLRLQVQAKRWLHTVGRPEVAGLRGSLSGFASGAIVTTSHFSRAAVREATASGKSPIVLVNGYQFASLTLGLKSHNQ